MPSGSEPDPRFSLRTVPTSLDGLFFWSDMPPPGKHPMKIAWVDLLGAVSPYWSDGASWHPFTGGAAATITVGAVTTGAPGSPVTFVNVGTANAAIFDLSIPSGLGGAPGSAATIAAGSVTTLAFGAPATVTNVGTSAAAIFNFGIPAGATGPAGLGTVTPSTPARTLGTTFQPSATKAVAVSYSVKTQVTNPLLAGNSTATVQLLSDAVNPPTTERCRAEAVSSVGVVVAIALTTANTTPLNYIVPVGHYVRLVSSTSGTASTSIISQTEEALG